MKKTYINKRGEVVELDLRDGEPIPDGFGIRSSIHLQDAGDEVQRAIATITHATMFDAASHRPGYRTIDDAAARHSHAAMVARQSAAWRGTIITDETIGEQLFPSGYRESHAAKPADFVLPSSAARDRYIEQLSNAWKTSQVLPQGGWRDKNPSKPPPDVQLDSAPDSGRAWREMVHRQENAWRS